MSGQMRERGKGEREGGEERKREISSGSASMVSSSSYPSEIGQDEPTQLRGGMVD